MESDRAYPNPSGLTLAMVNASTAPTVPSLASTSS